MELEEAEVYIIIILISTKKMLVLHEGRLEKEKSENLFKWKDDDDELFKWLDYLKKYDDNIDFIGDTGKCTSSPILIQ